MSKQYITVDNSVVLLYTVYQGGMDMNLIINHTSMEPIYEQIIAQIKAGIIKGTLVSEKHFRQ